MTLDLYERTKRDLRPLVKGVIKFFNAWDENLTNLSKKLMKVFNIENDYNLLTKMGNLGVLEGEYYKRYVDSIVRKYLESLIKALEDLYPEINQFLSYTRNEVNILNKMVRGLLLKIENIGPRIEKEYEDYFNTLHEYLLLVNNLLDDVAYDVITKQAILDELGGKFLLREAKNLELLRVYMISLQNHSLGADINVLIETLEFGYQITEYQPENALEGEYHNRLLNLTAKIAF